MRSTPAPALLAMLGALLLGTGACGGSADRPSGPTVVRYTGDLACDVCTIIATTITLFPGDTFLLEETYRGTADGDAEYESRGTWAWLTDASGAEAGRMLLLSPRRGMTRRFRQVGDTALRALDREGKEYPSATHTLLHRAP